jgi:uncharacterized protein YkwD
MKMKKLQAIALMMILATLAAATAKAQCSDESISEMVAAINQYRNSPNEWKDVPDWAEEQTLIGTKPEHKGVIKLPVNDDLAHSASETAKKLANGTYKEFDHVQNGVGYFQRAVADGWTPSLNKLFKAGEGTSEMTGVLENLGVWGDGNPWEKAFEGWQNSKGHNRTMLSRAAVSIGIGCAKVDKVKKPKHLTYESTFWVMLVEVEEQAGVDDDDYFAKHFKEGVFYRPKDEMKGKARDKYTAEDYFEIIDDSLDALRRK